MLSCSSFENISTICWASLLEMLSGTSDIDSMTCELSVIEQNTLHLCVQVHKSCEIKNVSTSFPAPIDADTSSSSATLSSAFAPPLASLSSGMMEEGAAEDTEAESVIDRSSSKKRFKMAFRGRKDN